MIFKFLLAISMLLLFVSLALRQSFQESYYGFYLILTIAGVGFGVSLYQLRSIFLNRKFYKNSLRVLKCLLFISLAVGGNYLLLNHHQRLDLTEQKAFSLSDFSQNVVNQVNENLTIYYLHVPGEEFSRQQNFVKRILKKYSDFSKFIKFEGVDVFQNPGVAKKFGFNNEKASLFLEYKNNKQRISGDDELSITNAIYRAIHGTQKIYFAKGYEEKSLRDESEEGLSFLRKEFEKLFFQIIEIDLSLNEPIPAEVQSLYIVGPKLTYSDYAIDQLKSFVNRGGKLLLAIDPLEHHMLANLTSTFGLQFFNTVIFDPDGKKLGLGENFVFSKQNETSKPVIGSINSNKLFINMTASPLGILPGRDFELIPLMQTSGEVESHLENDLSSPKAETGKMTIAYFVKGNKAGEVLVFGDSDFLSNKLIYQGLNPYLIRSLLGVMTEIKELKSMPPQKTFSNPIVITPLNQALYFWFFIIPIPFLFLFVGVFVWFRLRWR